MLCPFNCALTVSSLGLACELSLTTFYYSGAKMTDCETESWLGRDKGNFVWHWCDALLMKETASKRRHYSVTQQLPVAEVNYLDRLSWTWRGQETRIALQHLESLQNVWLKMKGAVSVVNTESRGFSWRMWWPLGGTVRDYNTGGLGFVRLGTRRSCCFGSTW